MLVRVLVVASEAARRERVRALLSSLDRIEIETLAPGALAARSAANDVDIFVVEHAALPEGPASIQRLRLGHDRPEVVILVDREDPRMRAAWLAAGALAVLFTGLSDAELAETLAAFIARRRQDSASRLRAEARAPRERLSDFASRSATMQRFMKLVERVAGADSSLLIEGETGVGKERLARAIHAASRRRSGPFLAVNCAAIPEGLLESELFGHEQGAFTGASRSRRGYFELAHGGTLFLDEIGEVPLHLQAKLLRVLEDHAVLRVGGERSIKVDVRVITATNRDLAEEARAQRFRSDLYFRLAVVTLAIPPLRERLEDIPDLVNRFLGELSAQLGRSAVPRICDEALVALSRYAWPGNVRELINVLERALLLAPGDTITIDDLPRAISDVSSPPRPDEDAAGLVAAVPSSLSDRPLREARRVIVDAFERRYLEDLLHRTGGRIGDAARQAGINERSLYDLMQRHGLRKEDFRETRRRSGL